MSICYQGGVEITSPIGTGIIGEAKMIVHVVAAGGKWSHKGVMGSLSTVFGDDAQIAYKKGSLGDAQIIPVSNRYSGGKLWVCNLFAQQLSSQGGPPPFVWDAFLAGLKQLRTFALKQEDLSLHIARIPPGVPNLNWDDVHAALSENLVDHGLTVIVYTRESADLAKFQQAKGLSQRLGSLSPSPKKQSTTETVESKNDKVPCGPIFKGCNVVLSGYSAKVTNELKATIQKLEGRIQPTWISGFGGKSSSFLICETLTDLHDKVDKVGGLIVTRDYITACQNAGKKLGTDKYIYNPLVARFPKHTSLTTTLSASTPSTQPLQPPATTTTTTHKRKAEQEDTPSASMSSLPLPPLTEGDTDSEDEAPPRKRATYIEHLMATQGARKKAKSPSPPPRQKPKQTPPKSPDSPFGRDTMRMSTSNSEADTELALTSSTLSPITKKHSPLHNVFKGCRIHVVASSTAKSKQADISHFNTPSELRRYITAYGGIVCDRFSSEVDVIVLSGWACAKQAKAQFAAHRTPLVRIGWIWKSINTLKQHPTKDFSV
eukprot:TRINITY_DN103632_c0_g1_i1.p1 TRINITY_DN103632_c0_g1~~TRINITY_DN103632_c0_g1_i1.p1  ORF type:complete len:556 (-),score=34.77 TRINITY_DN103632_c0_g1_i1:276-1910(-)